MWHKICSISSCCLILIDTLTELIDDSIKHFSFSVRATITELSNNSLFPLKTYIWYYYMMQKKSIQIINSELITHFSSTSGLLCLSTFWEGKFRIHAEACNVLLTASKYGLKTLICEAYWDLGNKSKINFLQINDWWSSLIKTNHY